MVDCESGFLPLDSDIAPEDLGIKEDKVKQLTSQQEAFPPDFHQVKEIAASDGRLHYDRDGKFLFALAPNSKPSHLTEQQWLLSRTDWIKDWLRWEYVFQKANGKIIERKNFGSELERISVENPVPELKALAVALSHNSSVNKRSNVFFFEGEGSGANWSLGHAINSPSLTGKFIMASQTLIRPQNPPEDIVIRRQVDVDESILHEYIHYYTNILIRLYEVFKKDGRLNELRKYTSDESVEFAAKAEDLFAIYKADNGQMNIHEFLAYGLTNIRLEARQKCGIKALKSMPYTGDKVVPNDVALEAIKDVGVEGSLYNEVFSTFINYYSQIDPKLYSDRVDENGDPLSEHVTLGVERFRQLNAV